MKKVDLQSTPMAKQDPSPAAGDLPELVAEAEAKGYFGTAPDPTPNSAYSMEGGAPSDTPESPQNKPAAPELVQGAGGEASQPDE